MPIDVNPTTVFDILIIVSTLIVLAFSFIIKDINRKRKLASEESEKKRSLEALNIPDKGIERLIEEGHIDEAADVYRTVTGIDEYAARDAIARLREGKKR
ncbi:MAG: hypothetical protein LCI00_14725 [Chloroflexi bacterium]|nr:hypothetical protein [Chloroflexota bacterium]MCC6895432.1 hypothetical protein [Anaerolineae bacterium]